MTVDLPYAADVSPFLREPLRLFSAGKPLEAWRAAREGGVEPESLTNVSDLVFAGRLAARLGDERGYLRLTRKAWRLAPERRVAVLYRAYRVLDTCGPVSTLRFLLPVLEAGKETPDEALEEFERRQPLGGERRKRWIAGRRASLLLLTGDIGRAIECAEASGDGFHRELAKRMKKAPPGAPAGGVRAAAFHDLRARHPFRAGRLLEQAGGSPGGGAEDLL